MNPSLADISSLADIVMIESRCFERPWNTSQISEELVHPDSVVFMAYESGRPAGYVMFRCEPDSNELMKIAVLPEFRKTGIASVLYDEGEKIVLAKNSKDIFLEVEETNRGAIRLYSKKGFVEISRRKNYYLDKAAICMIKRITHGNQESGIS
jgi:ribosomal-protein-alanine N-acetyltransferase